MVSLKYVSTQAADAYFQDYPDRVEFFDYPDFYFNVSMEYYTLLDASFLLERKDGRANSGFANIEIPAGWCVAEKIEVKFDEQTNEYYAITSDPIYAFPWDSFGYAFNSLKAVNGKCRSLNKLSSDEWEFMDLLPTHSLCLYKISGINKLTLADMVGDVIANYLPRVSGADEKEILDDSLASEATRRVLEKMFGWKSGNVIPSTNDGAKNVVLGTQIDTKLDK